MSRRRVSVALAAGAALAILASAVVDEGARAQDGEYVLVPRDAFLHARPDPRSEKVRDPWARRWPLRLGPYWVLRFVAEQGDWLEVATPTAFRATGHCYPAVAGLEGLDLHLFVRRADVAPVTAATVRRDYPDGTALTLAAGVGLDARGRNRYEAGVRGASVRVELAAAEVAQRYRASSKLAPLRAIALLAPGVSIPLGGARVVTEAGSRRAARGGGVVDFSVSDTRGGGSAGEPPRAILGVSLDDPNDAASRATIRGDCIEIAGRLRPNDLTRDRPTRSISEVGARRGTSLRLGAIVEWPDGTPAGRVAANAALDGPATPTGPRLCFDHPLRPPSTRPTPDDTLTLCVDRDGLAQRSRARPF